MSHPLIDQLSEVHGYALLDEHNHQAFIENTASSVLFFPGDPNRFQETTDVAVVLPELVKAFNGEFTAAVVNRDIEKTLQDRYGFRAWPTLVFLRRGEYLGALSRMCDWEDYLRDIRGILDGEPVRPPSIGIPVKTEAAGSSACH